jgi:membrane protease YdiL (CAAX protease family)
VSLDSSPQPPDSDQPTTVARLVAIVEVLICSDFPTQLAIGSTFNAFGFGAFGAGRRLQVGYVVGLSLVDSLVLIGLVLLFLHAHGERPRDVILGRRRVPDEAAFGVALILAALGIVAAVILGVQRFAPSLHTVERNPLQDLLRSPRDTWLFALVVLVAGGVREEIQRAFLIHRFEEWLGGGAVGVVVTSTAFGFGHLLQGADAAIATGLLGAFWSIVYLRRRSAVAPMVSHAGFDLVQIGQFLVTGR